MLATIWGIVTNLPTIFKVIGQLLGLVDSIRKAFQKDPIEEIRKGEEQIKESEGKHEHDDTGGTFGGEPSK